MTQPSDMQQLSARAETLISALTNAILSTAEVAAERLALAAELARVTQRMHAFAAVLDAVGVQKAALLERQATATGPMKALLGRQVEMLTLQETAILEKVGVPQAQAALAIEMADAPAKPAYRRDGRRFTRETNGAHE